MQAQAGMPVLSDTANRADARSRNLSSTDHAEQNQNRRQDAGATTANAAQFAASSATATESQLEALHQRLHAWARTLREHGVSTLSDAILMRYGGGKYVDHVTHFIPGHSELFPRMESGDIDATLTELRRFDDYRDKNPNTKLRASGYFHKIGFNMGYVSLGTDQPLIASVNAAIADLIAKGELPAMAKSAGMTYVPPTEPDVLEGISIVDFFKD